MDFLLRAIGCGCIVDCKLAFNACCDRIDACTDMWLEPAHRCTELLCDKCDFTSKEKNGTTHSPIAMEMKKKYSILEELPNV